MSVPRIVASKLIAIAGKLAPPEYRHWVSGMKRELDFVQGDWEALSWAWGSALTAAGQICRISLRALKQYAFEGGISVESTRGKVLGTLWGAGFALLLALAAWVGYLGLVQLFPGLEHHRVPWFAWLVVIAVPEALFAVFVVRFWRGKRFRAIGVLLAATVIALHFAEHIASHWHG